MQAGPIAALGIQSQCVKITLVAYWIFNVPLCYVFTFPVGMGFFGLWMGMIVGVGIMAICFTYIIGTNDWDKIAEEAAERIEKEGKK